MKSYELHTQKDGKWKIDSVFDNIETAMHDARRADATGRYGTVRLVEEVYDDATNQTSTRTVYLGGKNTPRNKMPESTVGSALDTDDEGYRDAGRAGSGPKPKTKPKKMSSLIVITVLLLVGGFAAIAGLEMLYQM